jgi:prepilin-type N-terminal cleavage/methylation domain-containing protein
MSFRKRRAKVTRNSPESGFSLLEMLASVVIITLLMSAVFSFMYQAQKRFQGNVAVSESNQSARAALEVMSQEIGQAGFNPPFKPNKTITSNVAVSPAGVCVTLNDIGGIHTGDWLSIDTGANQEDVKVTGIPTAACTGNQIRAVFMVAHTCSSGTPCIVTSNKMPYPGGILSGTVNGVATTSDDRTLEFFGDIYDKGDIYCVVYSLNPISPATAVTISGTNYILYNLYRSATLVNWGTLQQQNDKATALVQNVLYNTTSQAGPTGKKLFDMQTVTLGIFPNVQTVVGTVVITLSVAVNPKRLESGIVEWYTMATEIRPLNLTAAITVNNQPGGSPLLPKVPACLPMSYPASGYYAD